MDAIVVDMMAAAVTRRINDKEMIIVRPRIPTKKNFYYLRGTDSLDLLNELIRNWELLFPLLSARRDRFFEIDIFSISIIILLLDYSGWKERIGNSKLQTMINKEMMNEISLISS